jgi:hypothetical protein
MLRESLPPRDNERVSQGTTASAGPPALVGAPVSRLGRNLPRAPRLTAGRRVAGRYRLASVIGDGSMGTVWAATDEVLLPPGRDQTGQVPARHPHRRGVAAAPTAAAGGQAIAVLSHPNVVTVYDILPLAGGPIILMELLRAQSAARDRQRTRASVPRAVDSGEVAVALCATVRPCRWCARLG